MDDKRYVMPEVKEHFGKENVALGVEKPTLAKNEPLDIASLVSKEVSNQLQSVKTELQSEVRTQMKEIKGELNVEVKK